MSLTPLLRIEGLGKRYGTGELALDRVNLTVPAGQVMALIGPSGAGKSTLIRCVNRLVEPSTVNGMIAVLEEFAGLAVSNAVACTVWLPDASTELKP